MSARATTGPALATSTSSRAPAPVASPSPPVAAAVSGLGAGRALPPTTRSRMEASFGQAFEHVRVHTDAAATALTTSSGAEAATVGHNIAFAPGHFRPGTERGDHLIAHELSHVVQQGDTSGPIRARWGHSRPSEPAELAAEAAASRVMNGQPARVTPGGFGSSTRDRLMRRARAGVREEEPPPGSATAARTEGQPAARGGAGAGGRPPPVEAAVQGPDRAEVRERPREERAPAAPDAGPSQGPAPAEAQPAPAGGGAAPALVLEPQVPPPPESLGPEAQARLESAQQAAGQTADAETALPTAAETTAEARAAVTEPEAQRAAEAQGDVVAALDTRPPPSPEIEALCTRIYDSIVHKRPPDEDTLLETNPTRAADAASGELNSSVQGDTSRVQQGYDQLQDGAQATPAAPATPTEAPPAEVESPAIEAEGAAPDPVPAEDLSLDGDVDASERQMEEAGATTAAAQLVQSGPIAEAREAHGELQQAAARDPAEVMAEQQAAIATARGDMAALRARATEAMSGARTGTISQQTGQQTSMIGSEEEMRTQAGQQAEAIFTDAQTRVRDLLEPLPRAAMARWEAERQPLSTAFEAALAEVKRYVDDRHSGVLGFLTSGLDSVFGYPAWIVRAYDRAEMNFGNGVCALIRDISRDVNDVISQAEAIIAEARRQIDAIFASLPASLQTWAAEQQASFGQRLDALNQEVQSARDSFNRDLAERAAGAVQEVRQRIHELRQAAGGLLGRIADALNQFLEDPFRFIINGLLELVGIPPASFWALVDRLGEVIEGIANDPMAFANNLLEAVKQGFQQFFDNIGTHLLQGLLDWLFSGLGSVGVEIPRDFSLSSIITFFLQVMGLTWPNIREILARHIGEENVALLEQAWQLLSTLMERGPAGIFEMIKDFLDPSRLLSMVMEAAIQYVIETLIRQVTVRIIGMLNPAGAILQAVEAIYKVVKWIFENVARIFRLVETIVNGAHDILTGNVGGMATAIESALAGLIPPVIDFLAGLVGLGDLPNRIADVIRGMQQWVLGFVDRAIGFVVRQAQGLLRAVGLGGQQPGAQAAGGDDGEIGEHVAFNAAGERHQLWVDTSGARPVVMVASAPTTLDAFLTSIQGRVSNPESAARAQELVGIVRPGAETVATRAAAAKALPLDSDERRNKDTETENAEQALREPLVELFGLAGVPQSVTPPARVVFNLPEGLSGTISAEQRAAGYSREEFERQLSGQQQGLNRMYIGEWRRNRNDFIERSAGPSGSGRDPTAAAHQNAARVSFRTRLIDALQDPPIGPVPMNLVTASNSGIPSQYTLAFITATRNKPEYHGQPLSQTQAELEVSTWMARQAALHDPDQIAGGRASGITDLGNTRLNSSIGSQWRTRVASLDSQVNAFISHEHIPDSLLGGIRMAVDLDIG